MKSSFNLALRMIFIGTVCVRVEGEGDECLIVVHFLLQFLFAGNFIFSGHPSMIILCFICNKQHAQIKVDLLRCNNQFSYQPLYCSEVSTTQTTQTTLYCNPQLSMSKHQYAAIWKGFFVQVIDQQDYTQAITHLDFSSLNFIGQEGAKKIQGQGKCEEGNFTIKGDQKDKGHYLLQYNSDKRTLLVQGQLKQNQTDFKGMWGTAFQNIGQGMFRLQKIQPKQGWNGSYNQGGIDFEMKFDKLTIDIVPNGKVEAYGHDEVGAFSIKGSFETANNEVEFTKTYQGSYSWQYWGKLHNREVMGEWGQVKGQGEGTFRLYYLE